MKKINLKKLIIIVLVILIGGYFTYKFVCLTLYSFNRHSIVEELEKLRITETITINKETDSRNDFLVFENIKIRNYFSEFEIVREANSDMSPMYMLDSDNNKKYFSFGKEVSYIEKFKTENIFEKSINENILNKYNIKNDIDLIKLLIEQKNKKSNIFTSVRNMKEMYELHYFAYLILSGDGKYTLIKGDYTGYIINYNNVQDPAYKSVYILDKDQKYFLNFVNFDNEFIDQVMSTLTID